MTKVIAYRQLRSVGGSIVLNLPAELREPLGWTEKDHVRVIMDPRKQTIELKKMEG